MKAIAVLLIGVVAGYMMAWKPRKAPTAHDYWSGNVTPKEYWEYFHKWP